MQEVPGDSLPVQYAKGFALIQHEGYLAAVVYNPWQEGSVYARYYLVKDAAVQTPADGVKIRIPLQKLAVNSATYLESLHRIGELHTLVATGNTAYIYNSQVREGVASRRIADLGDSYNMNIEKLMMLHPDALMATAYNTQDENTKRLEKCGIPLIYNIEWQETTPLGRAEWVRFIAAFYDKLPQADSVFSGVATRYEDLCCKVAHATLNRKPSILAGQDYRSSWSMPCGESFNANLYRDAGASYFYSATKGKGSISTTIEEALLHFKDADVWLGALAETYRDMAAMNGKYTLFKPYKDRHVYNFNKRVTPTGGSDYWEGAVLHADLLLADLVRILHPNLLPGYETTYIQPLREP